MAPRKPFRDARQIERLCFAKGRADVSANETKCETTAPQPPARRWYRSPRFYVLASICCLLLGGGVYLRFSDRMPEPPVVDMKGIDPAVVAAVEEARAEVRESPRSAAAWGRL